MSVKDLFLVCFPLNTAIYLKGPRNQIFNSNMPTYVVHWAESDLLSHQTHTDVGQTIP